jgi:diaminopimelate decarboxylase
MDIGFWGLEINQQDHLVFGGCDLVELAHRYETPLHVVDGTRLRLNYQTFREAFQNSYAKVKVFYSYKTNCVPGILMLLHEAGCGAEVSSPYELWLALQLGVAPSAIIYNGVNKSTEDLRRGIEAGVGLINIDSIPEVQRLLQTAQQFQRKVNVGIRIDPGVGWKAQFGVQPRNQVAELVAELRRSDVLKLCCVHAHIGSSIRDARLFVQAIEAITSCAADLQNRFGYEIEALDLGGGFGLPTVKALTLAETAVYKALNHPPREPAVKSCPSITKLGKELAGYLKDRCVRYGLREPSLFLEPGRAITSSAQVLLVTVKDIKNSRNGRRFALTDGGMQNVAFPLSYEYHHCFLTNRARAGRTERYFLTGPLCSPQDLLYRNWRFPALQCGDVLAIMDAGAYFISFSNSFSFPRPAVILVSEGNHQAIRMRESFDQMIAMDRISGASMERGPRQRQQ